MYQVEDDWTNLESVLKRCNALCDVVILLKGIFTYIYRYQVMRNCWNKTLSERPQFNEILVDLENYLNDLNTTNDSSEDQSDEENVEWQSSLNLERSSSKLPSDRGRDTII